MTDPTDSPREDETQSEAEAPEAETRQADDAPPRPGSELEEGLDHMARVASGLATRLFGENVTGRPTDPNRATLSPEADDVLTGLGDNLGRMFNAAGKALQEHPTRPGRMLNETMDHIREPVAVEDGGAPLTSGLRSLADGLFHTTEAVLDRVAPRRPVGDEDGEE
jgi:hypothetical protein